MQIEAFLTSKQDRYQPMLSKCIGNNNVFRKSEIFQLFQPLLHKGHRLYEVILGIVQFNLALDTSNSTMSLHKSRTYRVILLCLTYFHSYLENKIFLSK